MMDKFWKWAHHYPRTTAAKSASAAVVALQAQLGLGAKGSPESEGRAMACKRVGTGRMKTKETDPIPINELQVLLMISLLWRSNWLVDLLADLR